eukprot:NODE_760_length_4449_cov_0.664828.p1 type:complete len:1058 gc:universal NODE_760_length_4449_cov_0.664828:4325-1152(-)
MNRRTSSDLDFNHFRMKAKLDVAAPTLSLSTKGLTQTDVSLKILMPSKSSSFTTAVSLVFHNKFPTTVELRNKPVDPQLQGTRNMSDEIKNSTNLTKTIPHSSILTFSYNSIDTPTVSSEQIADGRVTGFHKKDPMELKEHQDHGARKSIRFYLSNIFLIDKSFDAELILLFSNFAKLQIISSEICIALAFALPYSFLDRSDLLILLIVNFVVIYFISQMKHKYAVKFHTSFNILTLFVHQTMMLFLNSVFGVSENNVSPFLLLIFTSCTFIGINSLPTIFIVTYSAILKSCLLYYNNQSVSWYNLGMPMFINICSAVIALITSQRNVRFASTNGITLVKMNKLINQAKLDVDKLDSIASSLLPDYVWYELKEGKHGAFTGNINKGLRYEYPKASILFADVVGFTALSSIIDKDELLKILNHVFTRFDKIADMHDMEKIKTVGDCYVAVGGITTSSEDCVARCALMGMKMVEAMKDIQNSEIIPDGVVVALRIGAHVGSATGGLIGDTKILFDIWSRDVSIASQMEQSGSANRVHVSEAFYEEIDHLCYAEKGMPILYQETKINTYYITGIRVNKSFLNLPFIKKKCSMAKPKPDRHVKICEGRGMKVTLGGTDYPVSAIQVTFKESQTENEFIRKRQKTGILQHLCGLILNLLLVLMYGAFALYYVKFHFAMLFVVSLTVFNHFIILIAFSSVQFRNNVVFEQLSFVEKYFFRIGTAIQSTDWDQIALFLLLQIYSVVFVFGLLFSFEITSMHSSFYVCIISAFIFQNVKFAYFIVFMMLTLISYVFCLSHSHPSQSDYLLGIFYFVCTSISILNNYFCNLMERNFYRLEIANKDKLYTLQDQLLKTNKTVLKLLPPHVVEILKSGQFEFSESFPECAVIFCEIIGLTNYPNHPDLLNEIISRIDKSLCLYPGVDKVKTIYSVYMAASGITPESSTIECHIRSALDFALSLKRQLSAFKEGGFQLSIKVGMSVGPVIGGLIGKSKLTYDIWGDTVNVASRMQSTAELQMIQVTQSLYYLYKDLYSFDDRGPIHIKGKGIMNTYVLGNKKKKSKINR